MDRQELAFFLLAGFLLDLGVGDPQRLYHPVRLIGRLIGLSETVLRRLFKDSPRGLLAAGAVLAVMVPALTALAAWGLLEAAGWLFPHGRALLSVVFCWQLLAVKALKTESMKVYRALRAGDIPGARQAVSMIVGRDTERLDKEGIIKAAVETVAENTSDGVAAPLFYMALGGPVLGWAYKAVNTMDSMVGYRNEKYLYFGRAAARLDDALNFLPSRLCALMMIGAAFVCGLDGKGAARIFKRDRFNHKSPNSAQTEAVCAGALGIRLAGDAWYFGVLHKKPYIGDGNREPETEDIRRANRLLYAASLGLLFLALGAQLFLFRLGC